MGRNIRDEIVENRTERIMRTGRNEDVELPLERDLPLVRFLGANGLICEVKRRSPSRGAIFEGMDAVHQAEIYARAGAGNLSVLTVPEGFGGSLEDLRRVKTAFPQTAVLRKDFLIDEIDIDVSWRAGADAVLLIAAMLTPDRLEAMYRRAKRYGMEVLLEIHDRTDTEKARRIRPDVVGINSRNLETFAIDPLLPLTVRAGVDWPAKVIYESGVTAPEQAAFAIASGFDGILVGEAVVRAPALAGQLLDAMGTAKPAHFWRKLGERLAVKSPARPLVKICGLTREQDVRLAARLGADVLGFVFWEQSKRAASAETVRAVADIPIPKVAVTVNPPGAERLQPEVLELLEEGLLDAVQLHGDEPPELCSRLWPVYFKAFRPANGEALRQAKSYRCPRVLLDAFAQTPGGSGQRIAPDIVQAWDAPLWLAGGITPDNVGKIISSHKPELLDLASGVEEAPGIKSGAKLHSFFAEVSRAGDGRIHVKEEGK